MEVPRFIFYMCTGVENVSSTAWLGMAFISMLSKRTKNMKAMSPKQLKYCSMDVKPKYNNHVPIHYQTHVHVTKLKNFNEFYKLDKVSSGRTHIPDQCYRLFEKPMTLNAKVKHRCKDHAK